MFQSSKKSRNYEEWYSNDDVLPSGWRMRKAKQITKKHGKRMQFKAQYMNSTGKIFKTKRNAIFYIKNLGTYSENDVQKFCKNIKKQYPKPIENQSSQKIKTCKSSS